VFEALTRLTDDELREVVTRVGEIQHEREEDHRKKAMLEIQRIAHEAGLVVGVKRKPAGGKRERKK
jgi:hypothetical protein